MKKPHLDQGSQKFIRDLGAIRDNAAGGLNGHNDSSVAHADSIPKSLKRLTAKLLQKAVNAAKLE